jgi:hypothetical protein
MFNFSVFWYSFLMRSHYVIKFLFAVASGALMGQLVHLSHLKWHVLGREAFLSYQANQFDRYMAKSDTGVGLMIFCAIFALGFGALYEGIAYAGAKLIAHFLDERHSLETPEKP